MRLDPEKMPATVRCADESSTSAQRRFLHATAGVLALGVLAAAMGAVKAEWAGWVAAVAFTFAIIVGALAIQRAFERSWYDGRALAESGKALTWQFAARSGPFGDALDATQARTILRERLEELRSELAELEFRLPIEGPEVTPELEALRTATLDERREAYREGRLREQLQWYRGRASEHKRDANRFRGLAFGFQAAGIAGAVAKGLGWTNIDVLGLGAAVAISLTAWVQTRDHVTTARAYTVTAEDLELALEAEGEVVTQADWERFVESAERAVSREHVMWLARRGRKQRS